MFVMKKKLSQFNYLNFINLPFRFSINSLLLIIVFAFFSQLVLADGGIGYKGIYINKNGTKTWYKAHNVSWSYNGCGNYQFNSAADFSSQDLGTLTSSETFQIAGFAVVGWTNSSDWVAGKLLYKVWKQGDSEPGGWLEIYIGNYGNGNGASQVVCTSGNDRVVGYDNGITNINPGTPGTYNLKLQALGRMQYNGGSFNANDGSDVTATFTITSSASDNFRSKTSGNWSAVGSWESSSNTTNWGTATLVPGSSATSITILQDHNITLDADVSVSGLTINSGSTFTASDASPRTLTISKSTAGSSTTLTNNGTWANGTGGSTVVFTGAPSSGDAIHAISGTIVFQNLTINKTGGSSNVGTSSGENSSLTGTLEIGSGGFISTNPPTGFYGTGSILKFNQGASATYDVNALDKTWSTTEIPQNITVASGKVRVNENRTATGSLIISAGATLELSAAKQFTVSTALTNNGTLTLKSANGVGTAAIITGTVDGSGTTVVEQFVSSAATGTTGRNWYISSPLSAATSSTITTETGNGLVYWNGSAWTDAGATMDVMKGYIAESPNGDKTIQFTGGSLNTGDKSVTNLPAGFNLVGNPYASYVDFAQATKTNVETSIWYRSKGSGSYVFQTYNVPANVGANDGSAIIPPLQSFWIKTTSATNTFGFTNVMRSHQDQSVATNRLKAPAFRTQKLARLEIAAGTDKDEAVILFNQNALNTFDDYDSQKMFNDEAGSPEIYTLSDNKNLVINGFNAIQLDTEIPLGFRTGNTDANVSFKLKASQLLNFNSDTELVLIDRNGSTTETILTEGLEYTFNSAAVNITNRFSLVFRTKGTTTGGCCFSTFENKIRIQKNESNQIVVNCDNVVLKNATIAVYNAAGQKLMHQSVQNSTTTLSTAFKSGVYLVKLQSEGKVYNVKVTI